MQKKTMWAILGTLLAVVVASVALVLTVGPLTSADSEDESTIGVLDKEEYFRFYDSGKLYGLSQVGYDYANQFDELHIVIPDGTTEIMGTEDCSAFNCEGNDLAYKVTSVILPKSLEVIGTYAFYDCQNLTNIIIQEGVTSIGEYAFMRSYQSYKTSVIIPRSVRDIYWNAFRSFSVILPNSVESIVDEAFLDCAIYCESEEKPDGWESQWYSDYNGYYISTVDWGCGYNVDYNVKFNTNGGSEIEDQIVTYNNVAIAPTAPTKDGYTFVGWYSDEELTSEYDFETAVTENLTLYAKWEAIVVEEPETPTDNTDDTENVTDNTNNTVEEKNSAVVNADKKT